MNFFKSQDQQRYEFKKAENPYVNSSEPNYSNTHVLASSSLELSRFLLNVYSKMVWQEQDN